MMKMKWLLGIAAAVLVAIAAGTVFCKTEPAPESHGVEDAAFTPEEKAEKIVAYMSDAQKVGQLMMIGVQGTELDADASYMLTEFPNGNVILFDRNMKTPEQVRALTSDIRQTVMKNTGVPPLIGIDQEGGQVIRMEDYLPSMPSAAALGQASPETAQQWAVRTGTALKDLGINANFAPVVDLDSMYERSYGKTPEEVIPFAEAVIQGYTETGLFTSLKHFPGIGKVRTDPHIDGDVVSLTREELDAEDGRPFRELIKMSDPMKTFVMVSNVTFPEIDADNPACLSKIIMTEILREAYGFQGLILSDDMEMGAMAKHYDFQEMGVRAIEAGADIVLVCHDYGHEQEVYNGLLKAYREGRLDKQAIDEKVKHIVLVKLQMRQ